MADRIPDTSGGGTNLPARSLADGRYLLVRKLAEGGTAQVYLGYDTWSEEWRAVKTLLPEYTSRPALRHRFEIEARTMKNLAHPNIIAVYDAGVDGETAFMVMEYAEGGSVIDWVDKNGPMPPRLACEVGVELCAGIQHAHEEGIIHRDVKPQNLLVARDGTCKVTDFGIAQVVQNTRMTMTGTVMGTIGYMAPEQHESAKHTDERADVYSIAATLYTLAKGEAATHLFMADDRDFEGLPKSLAGLIRKGAQYRRDARHSSVAELMQELEQVLAEMDPDPEDTAPLVTADVVRLDAMTPPMFRQVPAIDDGGDSLPPAAHIPTPTVEAPVVVHDASEEGDVSHHSGPSDITPNSVLPRAALTTGQSPARQRIPTRRQREERRLIIQWGLAGAFAVCGIAFLALLVLGLVGNSIVARAEKNVADTTGDLFEAVAEQELVLDTLEAFPTERADEMAQLFEDFETHTDRGRRLNTVRAIVDGLKGEKRYIDQRMTPGESEARINLQRQVESTLKALESELAQFEYDERHLRDMKATPAGRVYDFFD